MPMSVKPKSSRILSVLLAAAVFLCILTGSIALPIYIRPFYYAHIQALDLPEVSGFTAEQIQSAYDEVLDYLTLPGRTFGTGDMACSQSAQAHFEDCKGLFDLDAGLLLGSIGCILLLAILKRLGKTGEYRLAGKSSAFWGAVCALVIPVVVGVLAALDFERAFVVFHSIFFPGKDNWLFDPVTDQIITILPQEFFRNCAILILAILVAGCAALIAADLIRSRRKG